MVDLVNSFLCYTLRCVVLFTAAVKYLSLYIKKKKSENFNMIKETYERTDKYLVKK